MIRESIGLLGSRVKDCVTGFSGMAASVTFDAYGCVQVWITPPAHEGKLVEGTWFDIKRVQLDGERIMPVPDFEIRRGEERGGNSLSSPERAPGR